MSAGGARVFTLGHSPDPDDAFMFYAMAEHKIDLRGYQFEHRLEDIQTLNERALRGELDISAISIHAYAYVSDRYALLPCGASMGDGYGPMLVATDPSAPEGGSPNELYEWLRGRLIAVPGKMTSAYLALQLFLGEFEHVVVPFDQIFDAVKSGRAAAGLIIHEGQLTYAAAGFNKLLDLGEWWKEKSSLPLPLGGNVVRKDLPLGGAARSFADHPREHRLRAGSSRGGGAPFASLCARHGRGARRPVHRHVCERLYARLRRDRSGGDPGIFAQRQ